MPTILRALWMCNIKKFKNKKNRYLFLTKTGISTLQSQHKYKSFNPTPSRDLYDHSTRYFRHTRARGKVHTSNPVGNWTGSPTEWQPSSCTHPFPYPLHITPSFPYWNGSPLENVLLADWRRFPLHSQRNTLTYLPAIQRLDKSFRDLLGVTVRKNPENCMHVWSPTFT